MTRRIGEKRKLKAETLESRQLLHGGAMAGAGDPPTTAERVTSTFQRHDADENMELSQDEFSEGMWSRLSAADGEDENVSISQAELTAHLDARAAERSESQAGESERERDPEQGPAARQRPDRAERAERDRPVERRSVEERIDAFFRNVDTDRNGVVDRNDQVSEALLARLADADMNGDGVSAEELLARHETRLQARFDSHFASLDDNGDGGITADEVSERRWQHISMADGENGDGVVTAEELQTHLDAQRSNREVEREAEREANREENEEPDGGDPVAPPVQPVQDVARDQQGPNRGGRGNGRRGGGR